MSAENDPSIWTAFGAGIVTVISTMGAGFLYLTGQNGKTNDEVGGLRDKINEQGRQDLRDALDVERRYATKEDLDRLGNRLATEMRNMMREHETNIKGDIERRIAMLSGRN